MPIAKRAQLVISDRNKCCGYILCADGVTRSEDFDNKLQATNEAVRLTLEGHITAPEHKTLAHEISRSMLWETPLHVAIVRARDAFDEIATRSEDPYCTSENAYHDLANVHPQWNTVQ